MYFVSQVTRLVIRERERERERDARVLTSIKWLNGDMYIYFGLLSFFQKRNVFERRTLSTTVFKRKELFVSSEQSCNTKWRQISASSDLYRTEIYVDVHVCGDTVDHEA